MKVITRKEAKETGLIWYFTGKECPQGHITERRVINGCCAGCSKTYDKQYKANNKKKIAQYNKGYRNKNKEYLMMQQKEWYQNNKKEVNKQHKKYVEQNYEKISEYNKEYNICNRDKIKLCSGKYKKHNKNHLNKQQRLYRQNNKAQNNAYCASRRAWRIQARPIWSNIKIIHDIYEDCQDLNICTRIAGGNEIFHVDHIVPLQGVNVCGLHVEYNLQIITASENLQKGNTWNPDNG